MGLDRETLRGLLEQAGLKKIKPTGNGFAALCPFHANTKTPAWGMNLEGLWNCMNPACGEKGNLTTFLVRVLGMPYDQAAEYAPAERASGDMATRVMPPYSERFVTTEEAGKFIADATLIPFSRCPSYMIERGFTKQFLREMEIGFEEAAQWPGNTVVPAVTFPVRDHVSKRLIGLTRRALSTEAWPPYAHDFDKTRTLYLLHKVAPGPITITEGPCDALMLRQLSAAARMDGVGSFISDAMSNAVSTLGGRWSHDYSLMIAETGREVVLAFDNDEAGRAAREAAIPSLLRHGASKIHVLSYSGKDPGGLTHEDLDDLSCMPYHRRFFRTEAL